MTASKGISANLLQVGSKRRRTKAQIAADKQAKLFEEQQVAAKLADYDSLQQRFDVVEQQRQNGDAAANLLQQFLDAGYVKQDKDGSFMVPGISKERKFEPQF